MCIYVYIYIIVYGILLFEGYYRWREYCGLSEDLSDIPADQHEVLAELYA